MTSRIYPKKKEDDKIEGGKKTWETAQITTGISIVHLKFICTGLSSPVVILNSSDCN